MSSKWTKAFTEAPKGGSGARQGGVKNDGPKPTKSLEENCTHSKSDSEPRSKRHHNTLKMPRVPLNRTNVYFVLSFFSFFGQRS